MNFKNLLLVLLVSSSVFFSCVSTEEFVYLQDAENNKEYPNNYFFEVHFKPDDLLVITVNSEEPQATIAFNPPQIQSINQSPSNQIQNTYLVDQQGYIQFPIIGKIKVEGLTRNQLHELLEKKVSEYIKDPIISVRLSNFKYSVTGEVTKPGTYTLSRERITLLEALAGAGDLNVYGKRNNILVIREENGKKETKRIDITNSDFVNSPYYYLTQNDVIYVEQNNARRNSSAVGSNASILISIASIVSSITLGIITLTK
ncbi:MAG: polysaccharide biosynthesis/export family protein [Flavobacteriales bacterium]|nr:polysaccharide biosynthesis/export family protein [Flavobacteriales bacterium]